MIKAKKRTTIIAIIMLIFMILHFCFIILHLNHDITHNDNCPICILIHKLKNDISGFNPNLIKIVTALTVVLSSLSFYLSNRIIDKKKNTLVGLKVELIN